MVNIKTKFPRGIWIRSLAQEGATAHAKRAPGPGLKQQASSFKLQASSFRTNLFKLQAASVKPQAASFKRQATSCKLPDPRSMEHGYRRSIRG